MLGYSSQHAIGAPAERTAAAPSRPCLAPTSHAGATMHPDDLAEHRERREQSALRALERQAANLAPRVTAGERLALYVLCDAARLGEIITAEDAAPFVRARISQLDRQQAA